MQQANGNSAVVAASNVTQKRFIRQKCIQEEKKCKASESIALSKEH